MSDDGNRSCMDIRCIACGGTLYFSARQRGDGRCNPCWRNVHDVLAIGDVVNHDPGDEDRL